MRGHREHIHGCTYCACSHVPKVDKVASKGWVTYTMRSGPVARRNDKRKVDSLRGGIQW